MSDETCFLAYDASMMCVFQRFQHQPYQGLDSKDIKQAVGQQSEFKVPPHVSRDALGSFYAAVKHHCGVDYPPVVPLLTKALDNPRTETLLSSSHTTESSSDWRVRQIRQNERGHGRTKVCNHYTSKEGCLRGSACPYTHSK